MANIVFANNAFDEYLLWNEDKKTQKRIVSLIKDIQREPFQGLGKPEPLKGDKAELWSRRINDKDRLVYTYNDDIITIYQCKGHYDDK